MNDIHDCAKEEYDKDKEPDVDGVLPVIFSSPQICPENKTHKGQSTHNEVNKHSYIIPLEVQWRVKVKLAAECGTK
jgi:hypothetical protein